MKIVNKKYVLAVLLLAAVAVPKGVEAFSPTFGGLTTTLKSVLGSCAVCFYKTCPWRLICKGCSGFFCNNDDNYVAAQKDLNNPKFRCLNAAAVQTCRECTDKKCNCCNLNALSYALYPTYNKQFGLSSIKTPIQKPTCSPGPKLERYLAAIRGICEKCVGNFRNCDGCTKTDERCTKCPQPDACARCALTLIDDAILKTYGPPPKE